MRAGRKRLNPFGASRSSSCTTVGRISPSTSVCRLSRPPNRNRECLLRRPNLPTLLQRMRESNVKILVADPHANPALVRQIAAKSGAQAVTLLPSGPDYVRLFDDNVARLVEALKRAP